MMSFSQLMTPAGEVGMMLMTGKLIDRIVSIEGAYLYSVPVARLPRSSRQGLSEG